MLSLVLITMGLLDIHEVFSESAYWFTGMVLVAFYNLVMIIAPDCLAQRTLPAETQLAKLILFYAAPTINLVSIQDLVRS